MSIEVRSPGVGTVIEVLVGVGESVDEGDELVIIESMKMEIPVAAPRAARVAELRVSVDDHVEADAVVAVLTDPA